MNTSYLLFVVKSVYSMLVKVFKVPASSSIRNARWRAPGLHVGMIQDLCACKNYADQHKIYTVQIAKIALWVSIYINYTVLPPL